MTTTRHYDEQGREFIPLGDNGRAYTGNVTWEVRYESPDGTTPTMTPTEIEAVLDRRDQLVADALRAIEANPQWGSDYLANAVEAAAAKPFGRLGDGLGERLMGAASPDDYWPVPPVQEPTGALNPAPADTEPDGSDLDAHRDAEDDHDWGETDEQPGLPWAAIAGIGIVLLAVSAAAAVTMWAAMGGLR